MKVAIVHDDLVQWGGAEKVLLAISDLFPDAPIYTSIYDSKNRLLQEKFKSKKIITSFLDNFPAKIKVYKALLPLYPISFEQIDLSEYDLVISQTTRFAKSIITKPHTIHVCYCHTPPRFLWHFSSEKTARYLQPYLSFLRVYDQISSKRVDYWLAGSKNAQKRIKKMYQADSEILLPFVDDEKYSNISTEDKGYYLLIARLNPYKRVDIAVEAFNKNGKELHIVGRGPERESLQKKAKKNITFFESLSDQELVSKIAASKAVLVTAEEDFGMTPLEAQVLGKPVIAYGKGGALETVINGKTGILFNEQTSRSLQEAVERLERSTISEQICKENSMKFSKTIFEKELKNILRKIEKKSVNIFSEL